MDFKEEQKIINRLSILQQVEPSPEFVAKIAGDLVYSLPTRPTIKSPIFTFGAAVLSVLFLFFVSGGLVYASQNSLPGQLLYPLKKTLETAQLRLASNPEEKARLHLRLADERLEELQALSGKQSKVLDKASSAYEEEVNGALENVNNLDKEEIVGQLEEKFDQHSKVLEGVLEQAPAQAQSSLNKALEASQKGQSAAQEALEKNPQNPNLEEHLPNKANPSERR